MKREEAYPGQEKRRDHVLVSSSRTSPSRFGALAKTLLRFKSVPFGKVPTPPANPPESISTIARDISQELCRFSLRSQCFFFT